MAGPVPAIHAFVAARKTWMPGMTTERLCILLNNEEAANGAAGATARISSAYRSIP
jgi:hypothetical protein